MSSGLDVLSGSLRVRNSTTSVGPYKNLNCKGASEVKACPSVMSPETKRLLPPNTETVQTKPFPIRDRNIPRPDSINIQNFCNPACRVGQKADLTDAPQRKNIIG